MANESLKILPLGGLGEVGKNMMVLETDEDIVVIDAGVLFPEDDMPGIDIVVPNVEYLVENLDRVRAILITHGHEDHIGALPYVLEALPVPVYAPGMAMALIRNKLRERGRLRDADLITVESGQRLKFGNTLDA